MQTQVQPSPAVVRSGAGAARLGISRQTFLRLAAQGVIGFQLLPGLTQRRFLLADVERLAASGWSKSTSPADDAGKADRGPAADERA